MVQVIFISIVPKKEKMDRIGWINGPDLILLNSMEEQYRLHLRIQQIGSRLVQ